MFVGIMQTIASDAKQFGVSPEFPGVESYDSIAVGVGVLVLAVHELRRKNFLVKS